MHGILNINKPAGPTSHDIVARIRRILKEKRVGHTGTLDPLATGVLVVCVGKSTRIVEYIVGQEKEYAAEMVLGRTTTTQDSEGDEIASTDASHITREMVESVLPEFTGRILQIPPMVSAVKHNGKRLYELARKNIEVERQPREITIHKIEITSFTPGEHPAVGLSIVCSSGTYIRTICHDIGAALGVGGYMQSLVRKRVGRFDLENSIDLETLERAASDGHAGEYILPMDGALVELPEVAVSKYQEDMVAHGSAVSTELIAAEGTLVRVKSESGSLLAIGRLHPRGQMSIVTPEKVFAEPKPSSKSDLLPHTVRGLVNVPEGIGKSAVSIGMFDGVHLGHQALLSVLRSEAERIGGPAVVFTFDRHPMELLGPDKAPLYITTLDQKLKLIENAGADMVVVASFDHALADLSPEEFVDRILVKKLNAAVVVVGSNFKFGQKRAGDIDKLTELGKERGFKVVTVEPIVAHGSKVSSTRVRNAIERGDVESAGKFLGHPFTMLGRVVSGLGLGRKLGFPTANIEVEPKQIVPSNGVYAVEVIIEGRHLPGVCNIGVRPTLDMHTRSIEIYIDGFEGNIYGAEIASAFHYRLRDEVKFENLETLKAQIAKDVLSAREQLTGNREQKKVVES
ncbi:MAG: bifunctional riboflavin kinase/FAD synthetase [Armatimonadota bacterium]